MNKTTKTELLTNFSLAKANNWWTKRHIKEKHGSVLSLTLPGIQ